MATKATIWKTASGKSFDIKEQAEQHEAKERICEIINEELEGLYITSSGTKLHPDDFSDQNIERLQEIGFLVATFFKPIK